MKIELSLPRARFVVDEAIELHVRLHNDGATTVRVPDPFYNDAWQPTYVITGPAFPQGRRFSARSSTSRDARPAPADVPLRMIELSAGASHEGELPLSQWCPIPTPGAYTLVAELELPGEAAGGAALSVRSDPLALELQAVQPQATSVGVDVGRGPPGAAWVSFVQAGDPPVIYDELVLEDRPDLGELERHGLTRRRALAPGTEQVRTLLVPWHHGDRMMAMAAWRAWLHERPRASQALELQADDSPLGQPFALPLPLGSTVLPPAWQDPSEALDVLVLDPDRRRLQLARFTSHGPPTAPTGALVWHSEPRDPIASARLALGPARAGSPRRVVALETRGHDLVISCFVAEPGASGSATGVAILPAVDPVPGLSLAVRVTPDGRTRAWVLADAKPEGWQVYLSRVEFDADGRLSSASDGLEPLVTLPSPLLEAAIEVVPGDDEPEELVWALRTDDRRVLWSRGGRAPQWYKSPRPTTLATPMQLRPLSQATYLATLPPGRAPELVTLEE